MALPNPYDSGLQISPNIQKVTNVDASGNAVVSLPSSSTAATKSTVAASATPVTLLAANTARLGAIITNRSSAILYFLLGVGTVSATNYTGLLNNGDSFVLNRGDFTGLITGLWASATGDAQVTETS